MSDYVSLCQFMSVYVSLCKIMSLDNIFVKWHVKVIKINNNIEVNSFSIFRVNLQFSVRAQKYTLLLGYKKNIISDFGIE